MNETRWRWILIIAVLVGVISRAFFSPPVRAAVPAFEQSAPQSMTEPCCRARYRPRVAQAIEFR